MLPPPSAPPALYVQPPVQTRRKRSASAFLPSPLSCTHTRKVAGAPLKVPVPSSCTELAVGRTGPHWSRTLPRKVIWLIWIFASPAWSFSSSVPPRSPMPPLARFASKPNVVLLLFLSSGATQPPPLASRRMHGLYSGLVSSRILSPPWFQPV